MADLSWDSQGDRAMAGIEPLRFLVGEWSGSGVCHGDPVRGQMTVRGRLDGSWLEATEVLLNASGEVIHTDVTLYRFDVQNETLVALQLFERATLTTSTVELLDSGFRWITGPGAPQLRYWVQDGGFRYAVTMPDEAAEAIEMTYKRA